MVDLANAHFQHPARPLEALVSPPISDPRAMAWSGEELLVADREGQIHLVEPSFGARRLFQGAPDPVRLAISSGRGGARRVAIIDRHGHLCVYAMDGALRWEGATGVLASVQLAFGAPGVIVVGDTLDSRRLLLFSAEGVVVARARVPARTVALPQGEGHPPLARSLADGLRVRPFGAQLGSESSTEHHLLVSGSHVLGVASGGVTLWRGAQPHAVTVKLYDVVNAALSDDGETMALATRAGSVSVTAARPGVPRVNPGKVSGHEGPVAGLTFSQKGKWLASLAERVWVWGY